MIYKCSSHLVLDVCLMGGCLATDILVELLYQTCIFHQICRPEPVNVSESLYARLVQSLRDWSEVHLKGIYFLG